jgi:hypothetical protein
MLKIKAAISGGLLAWGAGAGDAQNLIINGSFENIGIAGYSAQIGAQPQAPSPLQTVNGWTTAGYNFLFLPGDGTSGGAKTGYNNQLTFWGSAAQNGGASAFDFPASSPDGGNFIALDGAFSPYTLPIYQTVGGLVIGQKYELLFYWAAAQQKGYTGATTDALQVSFGGETQTTSTYSLANHDFSGWMSATMTFTATAASQSLSFLAKGSPQGLPPFALLDGVSMTAVPEVSTTALLTLGMSALCFCRRRATSRS